MDLLRDGQNIFPGVLFFFFFFGIDTILGLSSFWHSVFLIYSPSKWSIMINNDGCDLNTYGFGLIA